MKKYDLFNYISKFGDIPFSKLTFNEVDAIILACFVYLNLKDLVPNIHSNNKGIYLSQLYDKELEYYIVEGTILPLKDIQLLKKCSISKRFGNIKLNYSFNYFDDVHYIQFFAVTFIINQQLSVITYRGTDRSMTGWRESLMFSVKQDHKVFSVANAYLNLVSSKLSDHEHIILGHSKGGALATISASLASKEFQDKIITVFDLDGPGFHTSIKEIEGFQRIKHKIRKIVPIDSIVGILLESDVDVEIVEAKYSGVLQHTPYYWWVNGTKLIRAKKLKNSSYRRKIFMKEFLDKLNNEEKKMCIEIIFKLMDDLELHTIYDFFYKFDKSLFPAIHSLRNIFRDPEKGPFVKKVIRLYFDVYTKIKKEEFSKIINIKK